jgi:hypothetical protein
MSNINESLIYGSFKEQLKSDTLKAIDTLYNKVDNNSEFELMFFNYKRDLNKMGLENFLKILEYLNYKSSAKGLKLITTNTLDINYSKKPGEIYRVTITGVDSINRYIKMLHIRKNHVIFSVLVGLLDTDKSISLLKKTKNRENIHDINDFDVRVRLSSETKVTKKELEELLDIDESVMGKINFRYKQRVTLQLEDNKDVHLGIDLTNIKMTNNINWLEKSVPAYELEIDLSPKKSKLGKKYLELIYKETNILLKIIQQSHYIMSRSLEQEILGNYSSLLGTKKDAISLAGRKALSLEVQHVVDQLPNKYAVTDKADGNRVFLIIYRGAVFLISNLLKVKNTGILLNKNQSKYNNTILDGELIFVKNLNKYLFMSFDCLYDSDKDIREISSFMERLSHIDKIIDECFVNKDHKKQKMSEYKAKFDLNELLKFHGNNIKKYFDELNHDLSKEKFLLVRRKYFIPALGGQDNEIFAYSKLLWEKYTKDDSVKCPYILDGLIYHPLDQKYITSVKDSKYLEYKWKPEDENSIDFYVTYERNRDTRSIVTLYDNSREEEEQLHNKPYRVLKLYAGKMIKGAERPVLFEPERDSIKYLAYVFLQDGEARDAEENIIQDKTVVEFYYNNDPNIPDRHRWVPMRTRYDKTESVQRYGKKYGNYIDIAYKVWRSIKNPVTMSDFNILSKDELYRKHIDVIRGKIDHSVIMSEAKENTYYQKITNLGKPMRAFHNWLKSILIYTFINGGYYPGNQKANVLDIAVGRGGDIMKVYYGNFIDNYVGIDLSSNNLLSPVNGALSRYNQLRKKHAKFPRMYFIQADGRVLLNYEDQNKALNGMSDINKNLTEQFFSKDESKRMKFSRINCQMAIHYFLESELSWTNFTQNLRDYLEPGGYLLLTAFDADRIIDVLGDKDQYTVYYTDDKGNKNMFFDIVKKYEGIKKGDEVGLGNAIDFHSTLMFQDGVYMTEYLVQKEFLIKELLEKCDLELVETDLFENQYLIHKDFFSGPYKYESNEKTRKFFTDVVAYYDQKKEINAVCYKLTRLYRHYVFRRKDKSSNKQKEVKPNVKKTKTTKIKKQKGGSMSNQLTNKDLPFNELPELFNPSKFVKKEPMKIKDYTFMSSVHDILQNHEIIPQKVSMMQFYMDTGFDVCIDDEMDKKNIAKLSKKLIVKHQFDSDTETALDKTNFIIVSKDCDDTPVIEKHNNNKASPTMILYNDGLKFWPIYKVKKDKIIGLFDSDFIKKLKI